MIAEFGLAALWLAAALAALQLLAGYMGTRATGEGFAVLVRPAAVVQALLCVAAFGALLLVFARTDLSVALVAENYCIQGGQRSPCPGALSNRSETFNWLTRHLSKRSAESKQSRFMFLRSRAKPIAFILLTVNFKVFSDFCREVRPR